MSKTHPKERKDRKYCRKCETTKHVDQFYVIKKTGKSYTYCKECSKASSFAYALKNPEKTLENNRRWRAENKDHYKEYQREYHRQYYKENPEAMKEHNQYWTRFFTFLRKEAKACGFYDEVKKKFDKQEKRRNKKNKK